MMSMSFLAGRTVRTYMSKNLKDGIDDTKGKHEYHEYHVSVMRFAMNTYLGMPLDTRLLSVYSEI